MWANLFKPVRTLDFLVSSFKSDCFSKAIFLRWKKKSCRCDWYGLGMRVWNWALHQDCRGEGNELAIQGKSNVTSVCKLFGVADQDCLHLAAVDLEEVVIHPGAQILKAGVKGGDCVGGVGLHFNIYLGVIGIAVEVDAMLSDDTPKWEQVDWKQNGHWRLWDTACQCSAIQFVNPQWHVISPAGELGGEPLQACVGLIGRWRTMVHGVEFLALMELDQDTGLPGVGCHQQVINNFYQSCFHAVCRLETGLAS